MSDITLALIQPDIHWENVDANLAALEERLWSIEDSVDVILLPETFNAGFTDKIEQIAEVPGLKTQKWLLQMASQKNALVGGSYLVREGQNVYNRFLAATPDGILHSYDKRHLFNLSDIELNIMAGEKKTVFEYKGWRICPMICYDLRFPIWSRNSIRPEDDTYDFDLLIYSANWPEKRISAWDALLKARAIENQCYVAGINRIGIDGNGLEYPGHSTLFDYAGVELESAKTADTIIIQKIEKAPLVEFREKLPFLRDER
jgi:omega-amidase